MLRQQVIQTKRRLIKKWNTKRKSGDSQEKEETVLLTIPG